MAKSNPRSGRKLGFIALFLVLSLLIAGIGSMAVFTDRVSHQTKITTFTFSADGYALETERPTGPFIANEDVTVKLKETNENADDVESVLSMSVTWSSPDQNCKIFGNSSAADNATISIDGTNIPITSGMLSADCNTVTFDLPANEIAAGATNSRTLLLHIPDSLKGTGELSFTYNKVKLQPASGGFSAEIPSADLTKHNFTVDVGWAASSLSDNNGKYLMGYLKKVSEGKYIIEYKLELGATSSGMKDFTGADKSKWSNYRNAVVGLTFPEGMTSVGDYAFAKFTGVSSINFPTTTTHIGASAFDGSGLTGELVIPATVKHIESLAFGHLPDVHTITFKHTSDTLTLPDNTSSGNKEKGAFYLPKEDFVETTINSKVEELQYGYKWHNDNRRAIPTLSLQNYWMWLYDEETDNYITPIDRDLLTKVEFVDYYMADGSEIELTADYDPSVSGVYYWDGSDETVPNTVTVYLSEDKSTLTVAGNGYGLIFANEDSSYAFSEMTELKTVTNTDILDTRNAKTMYSMFFYCPKLEELDISTWNVSKVEDMGWMFYCCDSLESMDLSKGTYTAKDGSGTYEAWNTTALKSTNHMFMLYSGPNHSLSSVDVTGWDTSKLEDANGMFWECRNLTEIKGISDWNVSSLKEAEGMFISNKKLEEIDLSAWQTTSLENTMAMFAWCESLKSIDITGWNMSKAINTARMFAGCESFKELTLPATLAVFGDNFASNCHNMKTITFLQPAGMDITFPTEGSSISYDGAFYVPNNGKEEDEAGYVAYKPKSPLGTKVVTSNEDVLNYAWSKDCRGYTVSVEAVTGGTLTANPTTAINGKTITLTASPSGDYTYEGATVKYIENGANKVIELDKNTKTFVMPAVDDQTDTADVVVTPKWKLTAIPMLAKQDTWQYTSIDEDAGTSTTPIDFSILETINIVSSYTPAADETSWDASANETVNGVDYMGKVTAHLSADKKTLTLAGNGYDRIYANPDSAWAFSSWDNWGFAALTSINGAEHLDTSLVTNASSMFSMNEKLAYLNVSNWDTSNIEITNETGYYGMFMNCKSLKELDIATKTVNRADGTTYTAWDTGSMIETIRMFSNCESLDVIDVSGWNMSSCYSTADMFAFTPITEIAVNGDGWNTSNLYDSYGMFEGCKNLTEIDLSTWDVSKLDYTHSMFKDSGLTKIDLSSWTESVVTRAYGMFAGCTNLTDVNIVGWNLSNLEPVTNSHYKSSAEMFNGCTALKKLTVPASLKVFGPHFAAGCTNLTTIEFQHAASVADILFAPAGYYDGAFYLDTPYTETAPLGTTVITNNANIQNYNWTKDHRGYTVSAVAADNGTVIADPSVAINGKSIDLNPTADLGYSYSGSKLSWTENGSKKSLSISKDILSFEMPAGDVTVTPSFTPITYSISYEVNNGTLPASAPTSYTIESEAFTLPTPTRENHTFQGWYSTYDFSGEKVTQISRGSTGNKTFYAKWTVDSGAYTVNHWTQYLGKDTAQNSSNYSLHATESFVGDAGTQVTPAVKSISGFTAPAKQTVTVKSDNSVVVNYYYTRNSYTFTLGSHKGVDTSGSSATGTYQYGATITLNAAAKLGYSWSNWTSSNTSLIGNKTTAATSFAMPAGNIKMTPNASLITYNISYELNGGKNPSDVPTSYNIESAAITLPTPTRENYTFSGWYNYYDFSGEKVTGIPQGSTGNKTLYAKWDAKSADYTVKHWTQNLGASATQNSSNYTLHKTDTLSASAGTQVTPTVETITGFRPPSTQTVTVKEDGSTVVNYYYTRNSYTFTLGSHDGVSTNGSTSSGSYQYGATITLKASANTGYTWSQWLSSNTNLVANNSTASTSFKMPAGNVKMTPDAELISYSISYNLNGGTVSTANPTTYNVATNTFTLNNPTKSGYTFTGWTGSNGNTPQKTVTITQGSTGNKSYTANWQQSLVDLVITSSNRDKVGYTGAANEQLVIPETFYDAADDVTYRVVGVDFRAFDKCTNLKSVDLPSTVAFIGSYAFSGCTGLETVTVSGNASNLYSGRNNYIGTYAFSSCSNLVSVELPENLTYIDSYAFCYCTALTAVDIPETVTQIGYGTFIECDSLSSVGPVGSGAKVQIPAGVTIFSGSLFSGCDSITDIGPAGSGADVQIPSTITKFDGAVFSECNNLVTAEIPDTVTSFGNMEFDHCDKLESIDLPARLTNLGDSTFSDCVSLKSIVIPDGVPEIGFATFNNCTALTSVDIPASVTSIDTYAFQQCLVLQEVIIPENVTSIGKSAFYSCRKLERAVIPANVTSIGENAFGNCWVLKSIEIPSGVTKIEAGTFKYCYALETVTFGANSKLTSIGDSAFYSCNINSISIPSGVTSIGKQAFYSNEFASVTLPAGITSLSSGVFQSCTNLTSIVIPNGVTTIGSSAFDFCLKLESVVIPKTVTQIEAYAFTSCNALTNVYYRGTLDEWNGITIDASNTIITNATITPNYGG